ncbi:MAG: mandelate racemase/muconate lactonizing enzyme family protein [Halocynthiibacter sp.]
MKIIGIETVWVEEFSNLVLLRLHTDEGLIGLGETFRNAEAVVTYIHETCAPSLLGQDPLRRQALSSAMARSIGNHFNGFPTRCVEIRGNSAVDIALWDVSGQAAGIPIYQMLGGLTRDKVRIYNTCAGASYNNKARGEYDSEIYSRRSTPPKNIGRHEDQLLQVFEPAQLAEELLAEGITAMKIWPFDVVALENRGQFIRAEELREAIWPIEQIRQAVGDKMDILMEYHGLWQLSPALEIADALEEFGIFWHEDPISMQNFDDLARYRNRVRGRVCGSENLGSLPWYREVFGRGAVDVASFDIAWIGGLSEGQRITHLAEAFDRPIAPHDCTGPVTLIANLHMLVAASNGLIAETVRSYCQGFYSQMVTRMPRIEDGFIYPLTGPGLGCALDPGVLRRDDVNRRLTGKSCD